MTPLITLLVLGSAGAALWALADRLTSKGKSRAGHAARTASFLVAVAAIHAFHVADREKAATKLSATLEILDESIRRDDKLAALEIVDRGLRYLGGEVSSRNAERLLEFASHVPRKKPNQAPDPTPTAVTPPAAEEARRP